MIPEDRLTIATPEGVEVDLVLAGLGSRFTARLLDSVLQGLAILALLLVAGMVSNANGGIATAVVTIGMFVTLWLYDVLFEVLYGGCTPGKRLTGLRVVRATGEPVSFLPSAIRNTLRIFELVLLYAPATISILLTSRNQRIGDLAAGTIVVRERHGGGRKERDLAAMARQVTVPPDAVATWDVRSVTAADLTAIHHFLERRLALPVPARAHLAHDLVSRIAPKVPGVPADAHPEYVLEGIVVAKSHRG